MCYYVFSMRRRTAKARSFVRLSGSSLRQPFFPATPCASSPCQLLPPRRQNKSRRFILLQTLCFSCRSFSRSLPLFSTACSLFLQNTGGMGVPLYPERRRGARNRLHLIMCPSNSFRINTCKSVSKQMTLTPFRMNTCEKTGGREPVIVNHIVPNWTDIRPEYRYDRARCDGMHGGHVPCGVTAHGSPGGPLQFDRLEAALAARFH
jgi:hypothetical protein